MGVRPPRTWVSALSVVDVRPREDMGVRPYDLRKVNNVLVCATQTCLFCGLDNTLKFEFADDSPGVTGGQSGLLGDGGQRRP